MQRNSKKILLLLLTIVWMLTIFLFSAQPVEESLEQSDGIVEKLIRIFVPGYDDFAPEKQAYISNHLSFAVRKGAHMTEYAVLSVLLYCLLSAWEFAVFRKWKPIAAWCAATLYAVTDEFHQYFVPGRFAKPMDVLIDSVGALLGVLLIATVVRLIARIKSAKTQP